MVVSELVITLKLVSSSRTRSSNSSVRGRSSNSSISSKEVVQAVVQVVVELVIIIQV